MRCLSALRSVRHDGALVGEKKGIPSFLAKREISLFNSKIKPILQIVYILIDNSEKKLILSKIEIR